MGLFDRLAKKLTPDYHALLQAALEPDDTLIAFTAGFPHGYQRTSRSRGIDQAVINKIVDSAANWAAAKHTTGEDGSIAYRLTIVGDDVRAAMAALSV